MRTCTNGDDDNNGLWTSLVVAAEVFRFLVTGDPRAHDAAVHYFNGMKLLNEITGIPGLMARSAVRPGATRYPRLRQASRTAVARGTTARSPSTRAGSGRGCVRRLPADHRTPAATKSWDTTSPSLSSLAT